MAMIRGCEDGSATAVSFSRVQRPPRRCWSSRGVGDADAWAVRWFAAEVGVRVLSRRQALRAFIWVGVMLYWANVEGAFVKYWDVILGWLLGIVSQRISTTEYKTSKANR